MNDIKTIDELRVCHERLKEVVMVLERLEERERKDSQSGTDDTPLHRTPPRSAVWNAVKTRVNTKVPKRQRTKESSPPQARVFNPENPERNELKNRNVG